MATIYRKSDKGHDEIAKRTHGLTPRLRTALIMIDGKRSDAELRTLIAAQADETLAALLQQGFIEVVAMLDTGRSEARSASRSGAATGAGASSSASPARASAAPSFEQVRREAVRGLTDLVGPMGEALAMRMEKTTSAEGLRPLLEVAAQVIRNTRGTQAATDYTSRIGALLP